MIVLLMLAAATGQCVAIDGDTLSCVSPGKLHRRTHIRLNGIDTPELPGHCHAPRVCAPGDPFAAKANLKSLVDGKTVRWQSLGRDRYSRVIAAPTAGGVNLSCAQLAGGFGIYKPKWDNRHVTAKSCPTVAK